MMKHVTSSCLAVIVAAWPCEIIAQLPPSAIASGPAQPVTHVETKSPSTTAGVSPPAPTVQVAPLVRDDQIRQRLTRILRQTGQYQNLKVEVDDGVVFLSGETKTDEDKVWAGDLARHTQDVVAVVNRIKVIEPSVWDFRPAAAGLDDMQRAVIRSLPSLACGAIILLVAYGASRFVTRWMRAALPRRVTASLIREVCADRRVCRAARRPVHDIADRELDQRGGSPSWVARACSAWC